MNVGKYFVTLRDMREIRGFTMIELMIVLVIIMILAAVAVPTFMRSRDRARVTACVEQLATVRSAAEDYMVENGNLGGLVQWQDLCVHVYVGVDDPANCADAIVERINSICEDNSFNWFQPDDFYFEITAEAMTKNKCFICLTSDFTIPESEDIPDCPVNACP